MIFKNVDEARYDSRSVQAAQEEMKSLIRNGIWDVVDCSDGIYLVGSA